jgi:hypothetical protein
MFAGFTLFAFFSSHSHNPFSFFSKEKVEAEPEKLNQPKVKVFFEKTFALFFFIETKSERRRTLPKFVLIRTTISTDQISFPGKLNF